MLKFHCLMRFPHSNGSWAIRRDFDAVRRRIQPDTALIYAGMGPTSPILVPHPQRQAYRHAPSVNGDAVLRVASVLRMTAVARAGRIGASGREHLRPPCGRVRSLWPAARIEQEHASRLQLIKIQPVPLTLPPARRNHAAFIPGHLSHGMILIKA